MAVFASATCSTSIKIPFLKTSNSLSCFTTPLLPFETLSLPIYRHPFTYFSKNSCICKAKRRDSPVLKPDNNENAQVEEEEDDDDEDFGSLEEFEDGTFTDADDFLEDGEEAELCAGDGAGGGGISLAGTEWDNKALAIAEETILLFNGELKIYAFQTLKNATIRVRVEKLSNRSGSPSMADIEEFSSAYRAKLDEAEEAGSIPANTSLEVSSPGVERVVQIPQDLDRFKERPMHVKYVTEASTSDSFSESDGVFKLVSFDLESECCTWGIADVKINREKAGKGRPLNKKQREWRLITPFQSLRLVRIYSDL